MNTERRVDPHHRTPLSPLTRSMVGTEARHHRDGEAQAAGAARLEADEDDPVEMLAVAHIMESLRAAR